MKSDLLSEIDQSIRGHQEAVNTALALERLKLSRDFKVVVLDGYLTKEAVRLVHLRGSSSKNSLEEQASVLARIDAIGHFYEYLNQIQDAAVIAQKGIAADEQTREEILAEDR